MSNRPAQVRQRTIQQVICAARKAGAKQVELRIGEATVVIPLCEDEQKPVAPDEEITL